MSKRQTGSSVPNEALSARVASLVEACGVNATSKLLGIGREPLARIAGRMPVRAGTIALVERELARTPGREAA